MIWKIALWSVGTVYLFGFIFVLLLNLNIGPVTPALAFVRAVVWPVWMLTGRPAGERLPMD